MEKERAYPKLRQLDIIPTEISGQKVFALRDPLNLSGKILFFPYPAFFIISLFDGERSITDIQVEFMRRFGKLIYREKIYELIEQLEQHYLLESERFWNAQKGIVADFKKASLRPMALIGEAYADDKEETKNMINSFFYSPAGPGLPEASFPPTKNLIGVIAPHIDYRRGGHCYAFAHKAILESVAADLYIILGIAHASTKTPYVITGKDFETPWGVVETDRSFISELEIKLSFDPYEDEFAHKAEHSVELQLIFLKSLWSDRPSFKIVPILCGSFHEAILTGKNPREMETIKSFLDGLKAVISFSRGRKICLLASADLAHLGLRFGDAEEPNRFSLETLQEDDLRLLKFAEQVDAEGFYQVIKQERDRRRICGLPAIYTLLYLLSNWTQRGNLLKYSQSFDPVTKSVVTFASMAFYS